MTGSWKWNVYVGIMAMFITLFTSAMNNEWLTSIFRSIYAFIIVFAAMYVIRFVLGTIAGLNYFTNFDDHTMIEPSDRSTNLAGSSVNLATPSDDVLVAEMLKEQLNADQNKFTPLQPQKLVSMEKLDPEMLAQSLRHMSEE